MACRTFNKEILVHCNRHGKILYELVFDDPTSAFSIISPSMAIVLQTRKNRILEIDLEEHEVKTIPFLFMSEQTDFSKILNFNISRMFCIKEIGGFEDHRLKLTYFSQDFLATRKPIAIYESSEAEWSNDSTIVKGNEKSMVIWFKQFQKFNL